MNAFVKKEIRLLLPNFGFAVVLALAGIFFSDKPESVLNGLTYFVECIFCPAVAVMLALSPFGVEVSSGTFANLLAQPVPRLKIWETKITLLGVALLTLACIWFATFLFNATHANAKRFNDWLDLFSVVITFGLVVFSGGLWTVLLLRQVAAAFWFTLLVPGVLLTILAALFSEHDGNFFEGMVVSVLGVYSLAGLFFARWLFLRAQDLQWSGGAIVMPEIRGLSRFKSTLSARIWRPRAALWRKEFMLHQSQFVMAFVLAVLHLGVLAVPHFYDLSKSRDLKFILEIFWCLWMAMPFLVGCAAVAEERKLGTLEGQLCLPVNRRTQFAIKIIVVIFLSILLGVVMPLLFEGKRILPDVHFDFWIALVMLNVILPLLTLVGIALLIGGVSFYISSLARNTLQSLAPAVVGILLMCFLLVAAGIPWVRAFDFMWRGPLAYFIIVPLVLVVLVALAYWNFQQVRTSPQMGWRNLLAFVVALVLGAAATSAVYHRAWEKLTPFERAHGAARLSLSNPARLRVWWNESSVRLPDGKIWNARFESDQNALSPIAALMGNFKVALQDAKYYPGSNWVNVQRYGGELIGVKTDGTLWVSEEPMAESKSHHVSRQAQEQKMRNLVQFGEETNWASAHPTYLSALLVKKDGTLWRLGTYKFDGKHQDWPGLRKFTPYQLRKDSDWATAGEDAYQLTLQKTNGSIWIPMENYSRTNGLKALELEPDFSIVQLYDGSHGKFRSTAQITHGLQYKVGVREDGTFRIWADLHLDEGRRTYDFAPTDLQIGNGTNWVAMTGGYQEVVTLKDDGTLWLWDFRDRSYGGGSREHQELEVLKTVPVQLGSHTDWVSISGINGSIFALAADGSLWFWPVGSVDNFYDNRSDRPSIHPLLDISRKPRWLGNIFAATE